MFLGKPCYKKHIHFVITENAKKTLLKPDTIIFANISVPFEKDYPGSKVKNITLIENKEFETKFNIVRSQLGRSEKNDHIETQSKETLLYHGTCERFLDDIYNNGFKLPADYNQNSKCQNFPGNKTTSSSLCDVSCPDCCGKGKVQHQWNLCHMFGLGIYFADVRYESI